MDSRTLIDAEPLASGRKMKATIFAIHGFAGCEGVLFYPLLPGTPALEEREMLKLGAFLNRYLSATGRGGDESSGEPPFGPFPHEKSFISCELNAFKQYVQEHDVSGPELQMMVRVAIGARAFFAGPGFVDAPELTS